MTKAILSFIVTIIIVHQSVSQGCSDAGFCTMGAMKPDQTYSNHIKFKLRSIELSHYIGSTTLSPTVKVTNLDATIGFSDKSSFQIKLPYQTVSGNFVANSTKGIGDISLSFTHSLKRTDKYSLSGSIGIKIPANNSNLKEEGRSLPMYYQTSLGSFDLIAGASVINQKWLLAFGIQMALTENQNNFIQEEWRSPVYPSWEYVVKYAEATNLKRGTDIMLRAERNFRFAKYNFNLGVLPIYRITKDEIEDRATYERIKLEGTTGLAFSVLGGFGYHFNVNSTLKFTYGRKFVQREVNPDGLTRHDVMIAAYLFRF